MEIENKNSFLAKDHLEGICPLRMSRIVNEFSSGFRFLKKYDKTVTFFGSSRAKPKTKYYKEAEKLAYEFSKKGYTIVTGGGGGVMEAANKGAYLAGGNSVGININLPKEQMLNKYVKDSISFQHFFTRKVMLTFASQAYIFFPGGFGTLDEFFEIVTLIQTGKVKKIPVILIHQSYWQPIIELIEKKFYKEKSFIDKKDTKIYSLANTIEGALKLMPK